MGQLISHLMDFHEICFRKSGEKIEITLKSDKNNGYVTWRPMHIFLSCRGQFIEWEMFQTKVVKNLFFSENHAVYEVMWKNIVEPDRPQITIWRMLSAHLSTNTRSEYVVPIAFPLQQWLEERPCMLRYTYSASFLFNITRDWWETCLTVVGHVLWPERGGSCRGCGVSVDESVRFGNILVFQVIICFRLSLHFVNL